MLPAAALVSNLYPVGHPLVHAQHGDQGTYTVDTTGKVTQVSTGF